MNDRVSLFSSDPDRRRHGFANTLRRGYHDLRFHFDDWLSDFPCNVVGHHWVEIPESLRRSKHSDGKKMRFRCSRCFLTAGFSNR